MYRITSIYESHIVGVYTKEQKTATNKKQMERKYMRMLQKCLKTLCPHMSWKKMKNLSTEQLQFLIQERFKFLNNQKQEKQERSFTIFVERIINLEDLE